MEWGTANHGADKHGAGAEGPNILIQRKQEVNYDTGSSLGTGNLKAHLHSDTLPSARWHLE